MGGLSGHVVAYEKAENGEMRFDWLNRVKVIRDIPSNSLSSPPPAQLIGLTPIQAASDWLVNPGRVFIVELGVLFWLPNLITSQKYGVFFVGFWAVK